MPQPVKLSSSLYVCAANGQGYCSIATTDMYKDCKVTAASHHLLAQCMAAIRALVA